VLPNRAGRPRSLNTRPNTRDIRGRGGASGRGARIPSRRGGRGGIQSTRRDRNRSPNREEFEVGPDGERIPPSWYVCHRCNVAGHWITECPNGDNDLANTPIPMRTRGRPPRPSHTSGRGASLRRAPQQPRPPQRGRPTSRPGGRPIQRKRDRAESRSPSADNEKRKKTRGKHKKKKKTLENPRNLKSQRRKRKIQVIVGVVIVIVIVIVKTKLLNVINQRIEIKVMRIDRLEVVKEVLKEVVDKVKPMDLAQHKQRVERMPFVVLSSLLQGGVRTVPIVSTVMWNNRQLKCCPFLIGIF